MRSGRPTVDSISFPHHDKPYPQDTYMYVAPRDTTILKSKRKSFPSVVGNVQFPKQQSAGGIRKIELRTLGRFIGRWPNLVVLKGKL